MRRLCLPLRRVFLSLLSAPAVWVACTALAWADPGCTVAALRGAVLLEHNGTRSALASGQAIEAGDSVTTQAGARVRLLFGDGSEVSLGERSELRITTASFDQAANTRNILLDLSRGLLRAAAAKLKAAGSRFEIHTPIAYSAVRGTHWIVLARSNETRVYVQEGRVAVGASFATDQFAKLIEAGYFVSVTAQKGIGAVQQSPAGALNDLVDQTEAALENGASETVQTASADPATNPADAASGAAANTTTSVAGTASSTVS